MYQYVSLLHASTNIGQLQVSLNLLMRLQRSHPSPSIGEGDALCLCHVYFYDVFWCILRSACMYLLYGDG
jgi:hypothetical protein